MKIDMFNLQKNITSAKKKPALQPVCFVQSVETLGNFLETKKKLMHIIRSPLKEKKRTP